MSDAAEERQRLRTRALGWAVRIVPVEPTIGAAAGIDVTFDAPMRVSADDALAQALMIAMVTVQGSDPFNLQFGFRGLAAIAEESDAILRRERLRLAVIEVLRAEPRVRRIIAVRFPHEMPEPMQPRADRNPPQPGDRVLEIHAEFETIAGDRQVVVLGGQSIDVR